MRTKKPMRSFIPWPENQERLQLADRLGLNVSELINEVLRDNIAEHLKRKANLIRQAVAQ